MKRRHLLAASWPALAAPSTFAQPRVGPRRIGFLVGFERPAQGESMNVTGVLTELRRLGLSEGPALVVQVRYGGTTEALERAASELLALDVDLIVAVFTPAALAARRATQRVPIVLSAVGDPVANSLVSSLAAPGGNVTGMAAFAPELATKNLELIREWLPTARRIAVLAHATDPFTPVLMAELGRAAAKLGFQLLPKLAVDESTYTRYFEEWRRERAEALMVQPSLPAAPAAKMALHYRLPSCSFSAGYAHAGGLFGLGPEPKEIYEATAQYIKRILDGEPAGSLPVRQPSRFVLVLNAGTARAIGLAVPQALRLRADEVIG